MMYVTCSAPGQKSTGESKGVALLGPCIVLSAHGSSPSVSAESLLLQVSLCSNLEEDTEAGPIPRPLSGFPHSQQGPGQLATPIHTFCSKGGEATEADLRLNRKVQPALAQRPPRLPRHNPRGIFSKLSAWRGQGSPKSKVRGVNFTESR